MNRPSAILALLALGATTCAVRADTLLKGAPGTKPIPRTDVKIIGVSDGVLSYSTATGGTGTADLADVQKLAIDGQPTFNGAEDAYEARTFPAALDGYTAVLSSGTAPTWMRVRSAQRLAIVGRQLHRYDAEVTAYAALIGTDPSSAATVRPVAPEKHDPRLDAAATAVTRALGTASGSGQRTALLGIQLDIAQARGDKSAVAATLQQMVSAGGATADVQARLKLANAQTSLDAKQFAQAEATLKQSSAMFTDPAQQVDALYLLAQARDGQAVTGDDAQRDVAIAYLRVVTFGSDLPDKPHVADALLRAAEIEEKLADIAGARTLYQQLATDPAFARSPAANEGRSALDRIKK
jgi:TolA-binding protein